MEKELKTLKDITGKELYSEIYHKPQFFVNSDELKQEAVKWVKRLSTGKCIESQYKQTTDWIKHFFNLTEGDLE